MPHGVAVQPPPGVIQLRADGSRFRSRPYHEVYADPAVSTLMLMTVAEGLD